MDSPIVVVPSWNGFQLFGLKEFTLSVLNEFIIEFINMASSYKGILIPILGIPICYYYSKPIIVGLSWIPYNPFRFTLLRWLKLQNNIDVVLFHLKWFPLTSLYSFQLSTVHQLFRYNKLKISLETICRIFLGITIWNADLPITKDGHSEKSSSSLWNLLYDLLFHHELQNDESYFAVVLYQNAIDRAQSISNKSSDIIILKCYGELIFRILRKGEESFALNPSWNLTSWYEATIQRFQQISDGEFYSQLFLDKFHSYLPIHTL